MILFNCFTSKINRLLLQLIVWTFTIERFERSLSKKSLSRKKSIVALQLRVLVFLFWVLALRVMSFLFFSWDLKVDECQSNLYVMSKYLFFLRLLEVSRLLLQVSPLYQKKSFPLRISLVNVTKSATADLVTFTGESLMENFIFCVVHSLMHRPIYNNLFQILQLLKLKGSIPRFWLFVGWFSYFSKWPLPYMKSMWQLILKILQKEVFSLYLKV